MGYCGTADSCCHAGRGRVHVWRDPCFEFCLSIVTVCALGGSPAGGEREVEA